MKLIIDTNVPKAANGEATPQASPDCVRACLETVQDVMNDLHSLVIDAGWRILREYMRQLRSSGQPGMGDAFLKWVLTNQANPQRCAQVSITPVTSSQKFKEFPVVPELSTFDPSDRKFVAVALAHPQRPPIVNATDSDWWHYRQSLKNCGVNVKFLCPDIMERMPQPG